MILNVYKEKDMTSRDVVNILNKHFKTKKIGHTGTLDPLATGVLVCLIGKDTKLVNTITCEDKEYIAEMRLGILTDTLDIEGNIIKEDNKEISKEQIISVFKTFSKEYEQTVPKYSAVKINGKKLYEYARNNIDVELPKRKIKIYELELLDYSNNIIKFRTKVSKGTYIRSLINDIANKLNTIATMTSLERTKQGIFKLENSNKIKDILDNKYIETTYDEIFKNYEKKELTDEEYFKVKNGQRMPINFLNNEVIYTYNNEYVALYEKNNDKAKIKLMF